MAEVKPLKNLLAICLGQIIRRQREAMEWTYDDLSRRTKIKGSYLKSVENANATLHISKAYNIYNAFNVADKEYSIEAFITVFSLISILETAANDEIEFENSNSKKSLSQAEKNRIYASAMSETASYLANKSASYENLFKPFFEAEIFSLTSSNLLMATIEKRGLIEHVEKFLLASETLSPVNGLAEQLYYQFLKDVPSISLESLTSSVNANKYFSMRVQEKELESWEREHMKSIEEAIWIWDVKYSEDIFLSPTRFSFIRFKNFKKLEVFCPIDYFEHCKKMLEERIFKDNEFIVEEWVDIKRKITYIPINVEEFYFKNREKVNYFGTAILIYKITNSLPVGFSFNSEFVEFRKPSKTDKFHYIKGAYNLQIGEVDKVLSYLADFSNKRKK